MSFISSVTTPVSQATGFFGKLPGHGDFLHRNLPGWLIGFWDEWVRAGIGEGLQQKGGGWSGIFLRAPMWRFLLTPGICGNSGWTGILVPSRDRVGRVYPLTILHELDEEVSLFSMIDGWRDGFTRWEQLALAARDQGLDPDRLGDEIRRTVFAFPMPRGFSQRKGFARTASGVAWKHEPVDPTLPSAGIGHGLYFALREKGGESLSLWWQFGWKGHQPAYVVGVPLPPASSLPAMFDGNWAGSGWTEE